MLNLAVKRSPWTELPEVQYILQARRLRAEEILHFSADSE
jgi:hypothetical protein